MRPTVFFTVFVMMLRSILFPRKRTRGINKFRDNVNHFLLPFIAVSVSLSTCLNVPQFLSV